MKIWLTDMTILFRTRKNTTINTLYIRITIDKKRGTDFSSGIRYDNVEQWNSKKQRFDNSPLLNNEIEEIKHALKEIYLRLKTNDPTKIIDAFRNKTPHHEAVKVKKRTMTRK